MTPGRMELVSYYTQATQNGHAYLFINVTQQCKDQVKYLSQLFNETHVVKAHMNGGRRDLTDGQNNGRTNFDKMFLNSQFPTASTTSNPTQADSWRPTSVGSEVDSVSTQTAPIEVNPTSTQTGVGSTHTQSGGTQTGPVGVDSVFTQTGVASTQTDPEGVDSVSTPTGVGSTQTDLVGVDSVSTQTPPVGGNQVQTQTDQEAGFNNEQWRSCFSWTCSGC